MNPGLLIFLVVVGWLALGVISVVVSHMMGEKMDQEEFNMVVLFGPATFIVIVVPLIFRYTLGLGLEYLHKWLPSHPTKGK
jgi:uncharacterized membrane protein AbrB (regulator of aidB expression)